jgi:signal peptidase II
MAAGAVTAAAVLAADQVSKTWILHGLDLPDRGQVPVIPGLLDLVMVWNHGVTFGLFQAGQGRGQIVLAVIALAVVVGLLAWLRRAESLFIAVSLGAIAGGALGNVADRFRYGMVVDFLHAHWYGHDPFPFVFNLGDSAIVLGVGALLLDGMLPAGWRPAGLGKAARDQAASDSVARDSAGRDKAGRDKMGRDKAGRDKAGRDKVGRDKVGRDKVGRLQAPPPNA